MRVLSAVNKLKARSLAAHGLLDESCLMTAVSFLPSNGAALAVEWVHKHVLGLPWAFD
jgi:hypothetical protein